MQGSILESVHGIVFDPAHHTDDIDHKTQLVYAHLKQQYFGGGFSIYGWY